MMRNGNRLRGGFTIVELIVVVVVAAMVLAITFANTEKMRELANRTKCLQNLQRIGLAMQMYANDNSGYFPAAARGDQQCLEDFIYWQQPRENWDKSLYEYAGRSRDLDNGALVKYMGNHFDPNIWTCPSDPIANHSGDPSYPYSYTMNYLLADQLADPVALIFMDNKPVRRQQIRSASGTIMVLEESEDSINDGATAIVGFNAIKKAGDISTVTPGGNGEGTDWLAVRHDPQARHPDNKLGTGDTGGIPNTQGRGNVVFCDGHADFVTREYVHSPRLRHWDPTFAQP